eukprot:5557113-Pyramimonas_sp.AAC.1
MMVVIVITRWMLFTSYSSLFGNCTTRRCCYISAQPGVASGVAHQVWHQVWQTSFEMRPKRAAKKHLSVHVQRLYIQRLGLYICAVLVEQ